jgi:hypothetical protein
MNRNETFVVNVNVNKFELAVLALIDLFLFFSSVIGYFEVSHHNKCYFILWDVTV